MAMTDEKIVSLFWERSEQALAEAQQKYGRYCRSVAQHILSNASDAEECVNDAFLKAWDSIPPNRPDDLKAYLGKITRNLSFNLYKKERAEKRGGGMIGPVLDELAECIPGGTEPEEEMDRQALAAEINGFLSLLPKEKRMMFVSRYFYADTVSEIAKRFAVSENTVSVRLSRLRKQLKARLAERGFTV